MSLIKKELTRTSGSGSLATPWYGRLVVDKALFVSLKETSDLLLEIRERYKTQFNHTENYYKYLPLMKCERKE